MTADRVLELPQAMAEAIIAHARACHPQEACGLVAGRGDRAELLWPGLNASATPEVAFELDLETLSRQLELEELGLELLAIYHSHPTGPEVPSVLDVKSHHYPDSYALICSLADGEKPALRAFRLADGAVVEVAVLVVR